MVAEAERGEAGRAPRKAAVVIGGLQRLAAENDRACQSAVLARRPERDLHRGEVVRIDSARHRKRPAPVIGNQECASGRHLPAIPAHVPASVPRLRVKVSEVRHGQGDLPAPGGALAGRRLPGGCSVATRLARGGDMQLDHNRGLRRGGPTPAKAERNHDGRSDDDGCGGNDRG